MAFPNPPKTWAFQEGLESSEFNAEIRDAFLAVGPHLIVRKTADETDSTATVQNDDVLLLAMATNEVWLFRFNLLVVSASTTDFAVRFTFPSGSISALLYAANASTFQGNDLSSASSPTNTQTIQTASTVSNHVILEGVMSNGGSAGNLQLQWSGGAAAACTVKANSTLWAVKLT